MDGVRRQTVLDVIESTLKAINAKSFVLRIIYAGEYKSQSATTFANIFQDVIQKVNSGYCDVRVNGLLLVYRKYFFVVSEGSEDTTVRHINAMLHCDEIKTENVKLLAVYHNVKRLLQYSINEHTALSMVVPGLVGFYTGADPSPDAKFAKLKSQKDQILVNDEKLTASSVSVYSQAQQRCFQQTLRFGDVRVLADYLSNRLTPIWLPNVVRQFNSWRIMHAEPPTLVVGLRRELSPEEQKDMWKTCVRKLLILCSMADKNSELNFDDEKADCKEQALPEYEIVEGVLSSAGVMNLKDYAALFLHLPEYSYTFENCWPAPFDFTPTLETKEASRDTFVELLSNIDDFDMDSDKEENEDTVN